MKKWICLVLACALMLLCAACGGSPAAPTESPAMSADPTAQDSAGTVDVDLTLLSSTMVYSEVYNMLYEPESYIGKRVRMQGYLSTALDPTTGAVYFGCLVPDATACCAQGLEFVLAGEPDASAYPEQGAEITVTGIFQTYLEGEYLYCHLVDAEMTLT